MDFKLIKRSALPAATLLAMVAAIPAQAATLVLELDFEFSGAQSPQGPSPWLTAVFDDSFGGSNTVRLTMSANNLVGQENVTGWYFNFDSVLDPNALTFAAVDNTDSVPVVMTGVDAFKADGDGFYDILFDFPPPPGGSAARFTAGETVIYDITYTSAIDVNSFNFFSAPGGGNGEYLSGAHVQSINDPAFCGPSDPDCGSGWIGDGGGAVPVPASAWLFVSGLLGLAGVARRKLG